MRNLMLSLSLALLLTGCSSTYYKIWEKLGREKRDLLVSHVGAVKEEQAESTEQIKDALTRLQESYGKPDTKLQAFYDRLKADDTEAQEKAKTLRSRIDRMNTTARDLFKEWEKEIEEFSNPEYKSKSRANLDRSKTRFQALSNALKQSTSRMKPLLTRLHETTIFLKHNLNAQSLGTLKKEGREIERSLEALLKQINTAQKEADDFLNTISNEED